MIETRNLTKRYGNLIAANDITLKLEDGDVFGFIGPNGSGKTTTMRMIATLLAPDHGEAYVCGKSIYTDQEEIRRLVGFMPDFFGVYDDMTVVEYLEFFAAAYRINGPSRRKVCEEKLELVDMSFKRDAMVNELSRVRRNASASRGRCCMIHRCCCLTNPPAALTRVLELRFETCSNVSAR